MMRELNDNQKEWLEALESGKFVQGQRTLCNIVQGHERYCCLGVCQELMVRKGLLGRIPTRSELSGDGTYLYFDPNDSSDYSAYTMTIRALSWLGIDGMTVGKLIFLNDDGISFVEIARRFRNNEL